MTKYQRKLNKGDVIFPDVKSEKCNLKENAGCQDSSYNTTNHTSTRI